MVPVTNAIESVTLCQQCVDTKGFKGKGGVTGWAKSAGTRLEAVRTDMAALASATNQVSPRWFYLQLHARRATGGLSLRWRMADGRHMLWQDLASDVQRLPTRISDWYRAVAEEAALLNAMEQALRAELRMASRLAQAMGFSAIDPGTPRVGRRAKSVGGGRER